MYYSHGDTVIFRSDRSQRPFVPSRERERGQGHRPSAPPLEIVLADRVAQLEARLSQLETALTAAREAQAAAATTAAARPGSKKGGGKGPSEVRVSLQADGGAQATVGQVRMLQEE